MLNEIKEYEELTGAISSGVACRLNVEVFKRKDRMSGLGRAMTIIARYELEKREYFTAPKEKQKVIVEEVVQCLKEWIGFAESDNELTAYNSWLKRYYTEIILPLSEDAKAIKPWEKIEKEKKKQYAGKLMDPTRDVSDYSNKKISYEQVIADAVYYGPLKRYYMVFHPEVLQSLTKNGKAMDYKKKKNREQLENLLRLVAAYLIKKSYTSNEENIVGFADVANWAQCYAVFKQASGYFKEIRYEKELVLETKTIAGNETKIILNKGFLEDFGFKVVEEHCFSAPENGYTFIADMGAGQPLAYEARY